MEEAPSHQPRRRARRRLAVSVSGGETVEGVAAGIDMDEASLWQQTEQMQLEAAKEKNAAEEGVISMIVQAFIGQVVPPNTLDPGHFCGQQCFYGGASKHSEAMPSWLVPIDMRFSLYGCRVHGSVHRCGIGQCYATRVDRDSHEFCLYSGYMIGSAFDAQASEFSTHHAYFSVRRPATYHNLALEDVEKVLEHKWDRERERSDVHQKIIHRPPPAKRPRRRKAGVRRRTRVLSNSGVIISDIVNHLFFSRAVRSAVVDRILDSARRKADNDLRDYHSSLPVSIKGQDTGVMRLCDPMRVLSILSDPFKELAPLMPAYPWPRDPFVCINPEIDRTPEAEDEVDSVCQMIEVVWEALLSAKCVKSSPTALTNLAIYLVFCLGNSEGVLFESRVLFRSTPFLDLYAPSKEWAVHAGLFESDALAISVSSISEGQRDFNNGMRMLCEAQPDLADLKNNLLVIQDGGAHDVE